MVDIGNFRRSHAYVICLPEQVGFLWGTFLAAGIKGQTRIDLKFWLLVPVGNLVVTNNLSL